MVWTTYDIKEQIRIKNMYSLFEVHYDEGYAFMGESHNFWECVYVLGGGICVSGDERVYNLSQGTIIFHKPLELHKFYVNDKEGADLLIFSFSAEGALTNYLREKVFEASAFQRQVIASMLSFVHAHIKEESVASSRYCRYLEPFRTIPVYSQMVTTYLEQLMLSFAEEGSVFSVSSAADAVIFGQAINYLNSNVHRQPSVPEIARYCNISEAGLKRIFEKYAGIGVHKYLLKMKVNAALKLLQDGESVSAVAGKLGFSSQSYFSRAFKRETGMAPSCLINIRISDLPAFAGRNPNVQHKPCGTVNCKDANIFQRCSSIPGGQSHDALESRA